MTSSERVLGIPEVLELVLEYADVMDIFCWQRVDSGWQSVIQNSHRIQDKILFRSPVYETKPSTERGHTNVVIDSEWNPIILQLGRRRAQDVINHIGLGRIYDGREWIYEFSIKVLQDFDFGYTEASWKEIFVIKPAVQEATITLLGARRRVIVQDRLWIEDGITLGDLSQAYQKLLMRASTELPAVERYKDGYLRFAFLR